MDRKRKHKLITRPALFFSMIIICGLFLILDAEPVQAAAKTVEYGGRTIARYNDAGEMVFVPSKNSNVNYHALTELVKGNKKKVIVIPSGSNIKVNGVLWPGNNTTIKADGATITGKVDSNLISSKPQKKLKNLTIQGGEWKRVDKKKLGGIFAFSYVDGLIIDGVKCSANYHAHSIEIIACKNVIIQNSTVSATGKCPKNPKTCLEAQIQIDIATKDTAPKVAEYGGKKYVQGQTCENVKILNNKVTGARAVELNYTASEGGKWLKKFHKNITVKGNTITGTSSEGLAFFNVIGGEISNNTIKTKTTRKQNNESYTIGVHVAVMGEAPKSLAKSKLVIKNNTIYGGRNGIHFKAYFNKNETKCISKLGKVTVTGNKVYCRKGKKQAIVQVKKSCTKLTQSKNKTYKWK